MSNVQKEFQCILGAVVGLQIHDYVSIS